MLKRCHSTRVYLEEALELTVQVHDHQVERQKLGEESKKPREDVGQAILAEWNAPDPDDSYLAGNLMLQSEILMDLAKSLVFLQDLHQSQPQLALLSNMDDKLRSAIDSWRLNVEQARANVDRAILLDPRHKSAMLCEKAQLEAISAEWTRNLEISGITDKTFIVTPQRWANYDVALQVVNEAVDETRNRRVDEVISEPEQAKADILERIALDRYAGVAISLEDPRQFRGWQGKISDDVLLQVQAQHQDWIAYGKSLTEKYPQCPVSAGILADAYFAWLRVAPDDVFLQGQDEAAITHRRARRMNRGDPMYVLQYAFILFLQGEGQEEGAGEVTDMLRHWHDMDGHPASLYALQQGGFLSSAFLHRVRQVGEEQHQNFSDID